MTLRDLLKKKDKINEQDVGPISLPFSPSSTTEAHPRPLTAEREKLPQASEFTFLRSDTNTQSIIQVPTYAGDEEVPSQPLPSSRPYEDTSVTGQQDTSPPKRRFSRLRGLSQGSTTSNSSNPETTTTPREHKRLSERLHLHRKNSSVTSVNLPSDLPEISDPYSDASHNNIPSSTSNPPPSDEIDEATKQKQTEKEAQWEERATLLAGAQKSRTPSPMPNTSTFAKTPVISISPPTSPREADSQQRPRSRSRSLSDRGSDLNIQEAIRLHEEGQLEAATTMFHALAERGNVLSQVLYGLSLRHGWGCTPDLPLAVTYLSSAAQNSAEIESQALKAGIKKGGAAKGELVLAIFELGNCFRYGWGVTVDKVAARQYYETAANLGDTDAMNEAAWCYLEGFGGKKDKFKAAQLLRLAEKHGSKTLGNSWIWKEKYDAKG